MVSKQPIRDVLQSEWNEVWLWQLTAYHCRHVPNRPFAYDFWNGGYKHSELFWRRCSGIFTGDL